MSKVAEGTALKSSREIYGKLFWEDEWQTEHSISRPQVLVGFCDVHSSEQPFIGWANDKCHDFDSVLYFRTEHRWIWHRALEWDLLCGSGQTANLCESTLCKLMPQTSDFHLEAIGAGESPEHFGSARIGQLTHATAADSKSAQTTPISTTASSATDVCMELETEECSGRSKWKKARHWKRKGAESDLSGERTEEKDASGKSKKAKGKRPTHFLSFRLSHAPAVACLKRMQSELVKAHPSFEQSLVSAERFHVTLNVLHIANAKDESIARAKDGESDFVLVETVTDDSDVATAKPQSGALLRCKCALRCMQQWWNAHVLQLPLCAESIDEFVFESVQTHAKDLRICERVKALLSTDSGDSGHSLWFALSGMSHFGDKVLFAELNDTCVVSKLLHLIFEWAQLCLADFDINAKHSATLREDATADESATTEGKEEDVRQFKTHLTIAKLSKMRFARRKMPMKQRRETYKFPQTLFEKGGMFEANSDLVQELQRVSAVKSSGNDSCEIELCSMKLDSEKLYYGIAHTFELTPAPVCEDAAVHSHDAGVELLSDAVLINL